MGINAPSTVLLLYLAVARRASAKGTLFFSAPVLAKLCETCLASPNTLACPWLGSDSAPTLQPPNPRRLGHYSSLPLV